MVWYNPLSWFKNTPKTSTPNISTNAEANNEVKTLDISNNEIAAPVATNSLSFQPSGSLLYDMYRAAREGAKEREGLKFSDISEKNKENSFEVEGFSLDPYNVTNSVVGDSPINGTVTTEGQDQTKTWGEAINDAFKNTGVKKTGNIFKDIVGGLTVLTNAWEQKSPTIGAWNVGRASKSAFGGELEYKAPTGMIHKYVGVAPIDFSNDINQYLAAEEAYNYGLLGKYELENFGEELYEKYKNDIYTRGHGRYYQDGMTNSDIQALNKTRGTGTIDKNTFIDFIENEKNKSIFQEEEYERRGVDIDSDESRSRIAEGSQYVINKVGPNVQNSSIATVEARKEFMNDAFAITQSLIGRRESAMTQTYRTKAWLQRLYNTDDMYSIDKNSMLPEHLDIYNSIEVNETNYNQFIKNLAKYISLLPSYADPNTGKIERVPDAVIDPDTGKAMTYQEMLFDGITVLSSPGGNTYLWEDNVSPIDMLRKSSAQIAWAKADLTEGLLGRIWANAQYRLGTYEGGTVNEVSQQFLGRPLAWIWNVFSRKSGEVPFEFVDMDTSILSTITTNRSRAGRLLQNYEQKFLEYTPELGGNIIESILLDKGLSKGGTAAQLWLQNRLFRNSWMRNSLAGRQVALGVSYIPKVIQRLGTDQAIDAALSIGDMEPMSDISKKLSIGGTLLGEGLGILADLKVLGRSFGNYFSIDGFKYGGLTDPIKLMADNPGILDDYAANLGRGAVDESGRIVGDEYKLLLQDLGEYSKYLNDLSLSVEDIVKQAVKEGVSLDAINKTFKDATYDVLKQVFAQNSAMSRAITNLVTDSRANLADIVKYIGNIEGVVKIGPFISTIKMADSTRNFLERVVKNYDQKMDLIVEGGLVSGVNRGLTRQEVNELFNQGFLKSGSAGNDVGSAIDDYFISMVDGDEVKYFPTEKGLKALNVETSVINNPLAIAIMSDDTKELIDKLKSLPPSQRWISDTFLDAIGETNSINRLAENIASLDYLDICK